MGFKKKEIKKTFSPEKAGLVFKNGKYISKDLIFKDGIYQQKLDVYKCPYCKNELESYRRCKLCGWDNYSEKTDK